MTTIVYRDGTMAGDTATFDRHCYCGTVEKVFRNPEGMLLGFAGCLGDLAGVRAWFMAGAENDPPEFKDDSTEGLLIQPDGAAEWLGKGQKRYAIAGPFHAAGSGFEVAMGALHAGASAERACEIACDVDDSTRRPISVLRLAAEKLPGE